MNLKRIGVFFVILSVSLLGFGGCSEDEKICGGEVVFDGGDTGAVRFMTFNIRVDVIIDFGNRWSSRREMVYDTFRVNGPDVAGLQESLSHQVDDIQRALPEYSHYSAGRNDGGRSGESCAIFYRKDRFSLIDRGTFWFSDTPFKPGSKDWGNWPPRICSWVHLRDNQAGGSFYVYNVHLDHLSQNSRRKSVRLLAEKISERGTDDPFVIMGDFNMKLDNPAMEYLTSLGYVDAWQSVNPGVRNSGTRHGFGGGRSGPKIDHIPMCRSARALSAKIDHYNVKGRYPSDHFAVIAEVLFEEPKPSLSAEKAVGEAGKS